MSRQREEKHFDGSEQRTTILDTAPAGIAQSIQAVELSMVARSGIEPPTRGFSIRCVLHPGELKVIQNNALDSDGPRLGNARWRR